MLRQTSFGQAFLVDAAFVVLGTLMAGTTVIGAPAIAQAQATNTASAPVTTVAKPAKEAVSENTTERTVADFYPSASEDSVPEQSAVSEENSESAMQELVEALAADNVEMEPASASLLDMLRASVEAEGESSLPPVSSEPSVPGASALAGLDSVSAESVVPIAIADRISAENLATLSASFQVDSASVPALRTALASDNPLTQLYAADALWTLTGDADLILPTLMSVADSENVEVRELAMLALSQLGSEALPAVPLLDELAGDRDSRTRRLAEDALSVVKSENRPATVLGIIARETGRMVGMPGLFGVLSRLWR